MTMPSWRQQSVGFRQGLIRLEHAKFSKEVNRFVTQVAPKQAAQAIKKVALDLTRFVIMATPARTGRARGGWLPFADSVGAAMAVSGSGVDAGRREGSFVAQLSGSKPSVTLTNSVGYIMPLEIGSRAHTIRARTAKALRFIGGDGAYHFARSVQHPGTRPTLALYRSMRALRNGFAAAFSKFQSSEV